MFYLSVSGGVFLEEIRTGFGGLRKEIHPHQHRQQHPTCWGPGWNKYVKEEQISFSWARTSVFSFPQTSKLLVLGPSDTGAVTIGSLGSQALGLSLNWTTGFPGPLACRQQIVGLVDLHNLMSQFL